MIMEYYVCCTIIRKLLYIERMYTAPPNNFQPHVRGIDLANRLKLQIAQHYLLQEAYSSCRENGEREPAY